MKHEYTALPIARAVSAFRNVCYPPVRDLHKRLERYGERRVAGSGGGMDYLVAPQRFIDQHGQGRSQPDGRHSARLVAGHGDCRVAVGHANLLAAHAVQLADLPLIDALVASGEDQHRLAVDGEAQALYDSAKLAACGGSGFLGGGGRCIMLADADTQTEIVKCALDVRRCADFHDVSLPRSW